MGGLLRCCDLLGARDGEGNLLGGGHCRECIGRGGETPLGGVRGLVDGPGLGEGVDFLLGAVDLGGLGGVSRLSWGSP